ncbi:MAG: hypothetical protein K2L11_11090, partial [Muribaculaceae bacterium]|nr:hypothetical protein [Muribaculaceae bacterium]
SWMGIIFWMGKEGQATQIGCGLCPAGGADRADGTRIFLIRSGGLHSGAEGAEARSLRSTSHEWGSCGWGVVLLDEKEWVANFGVSGRWG